MTTDQAAPYAAVITAIADLYHAQRQQRQQALQQLTTAFAHQDSTNRERNRLESSNLNVFRFFNPGETTHSRLLAFFLDPHAQHGQGMLFLTEFLLLLGIEEPAGGANQWRVTAETGRIDVLLKRKHPHTVIILENKSNYAVDQPNQLYRYWHQEIYRQQLAQHRPAAEIAQPPPHRYRLVYLAPAAWKQLEAQSLQKPEGSEWSAQLPAVVPMEVEQHLFSDFVVQWLTNAVAQLPASNHRLREFTLQYLQFWQLS